MPYLMISFNDTLTNNIVSFEKMGPDSLACLYESTGRAIADIVHWLKFLVKVFKTLYLLNLWMEVVHTCPDVR